MNVVQLIGRLTRDPELRYTTGQNQTAVCRFSLAINTGYGDNKRTDYPNIVVFGKSAENCEKYLHKGSLVAVVGRIQTGSYEKDGRKIYTTDVIANNYGGVEFLGDAKGNSSGASAESYPQGNTSYEAPEGMPPGFSGLDDDDIPF